MTLLIYAVVRLHIYMTLSSLGMETDTDIETVTETETETEIDRLTDCCTMGTAGSCLTYCGISNHLSRSTCTSQHLAKPRICPSFGFSPSLSLSLSLL